MTYLATDRDGSEFMYFKKPQRQEHGAWGVPDGSLSDSIFIPRGTTERILGHPLTWSDDPHEIAGVKETLTSQWHDTKDCVPENGEYVQIWTPDGMEPSVWCEQYQCWLDADGGECLHANRLDVEKWMRFPLPV